MTDLVTVTDVTMAWQMRAAMKNPYQSVFLQWAPCCSMSAVPHFFSEIFGRPAASSNSLGTRLQCFGVFLQCLYGCCTVIRRVSVKMRVLCFEVLQLVLQEGGWKACSYNRDPLEGILQVVCCDTDGDNCLSVYPQRCHLAAVSGNIGQLCSSMPYCCFRVGRACTGNAGESPGLTGPGESLQVWLSKLLALWDIVLSGSSLPLRRELSRNRETLWSTKTRSPFVAYGGSLHSARSCWAHQGGCSWGGGPAEPSSVISCSS